MEVGAVKQAFNNEVILLKKKLNQARTQIIHKLTRKAKTLTERKVPEHLQDKLKKKAESAVNEVLIMKKIKARDIAKFAITHKGTLQAYLNKPQVDQDKACTRLLLHKALQDKYKFIRGRFGDVPIQDLFMSRQQRLKLKQEQKEQQKKKKKAKDKKIVNSEGEWEVEDVEIGDESKNSIENDDLVQSNKSDDETNQDQLKMEVDIENDSCDDENDVENESYDESGDEQVSNDDKSTDEEADVGRFVRLNSISDNDEKSNKTEPKQINEKTDMKKINNKLNKSNPINKKQVNELDISKEMNIKHNFIENTKPVKKSIDKKVKDNKNKNLNEKLQSRKFKKDDVFEGALENKIVDPFFITATGENYLSLAEPRQPDEVKEIHKQGNRKERRAAMFGHFPKTKPKRDQRQNFNGNFEKRNYSNRNSDENSEFKPRFNKFNDNSKFNGKHTKFSDNITYNDSNKFDKSNDRKFNNNRSEEKVEKLHPSWEAKKKQSTILPFQGKKIVFNES